MRKSLSLFSICLIIFVSCFILSACGSNVTLSIKFDSNGGTECRSINYKIGKSFNMPKDPTKDEHLFAGWYLDEDVWQQPFTINTVLNYPLTKDIELVVHAKWTDKEKYVFNSNGGSNCESLYTKGATALPTPTKEDNLFLGWYLDNGTFDSKYEIGEEVSPNKDNEILLYAKWESYSPKTIHYRYTELSYNSTTDEFERSETLEVNSLHVDRPLTLMKPSNIGFHFNGWYYDSNLTKKAPDTLEYEDISGNEIYLYGDWTQKEIKNVYVNDYFKTDYTYGEDICVLDLYFYNSTNVPKVIIEYNGYPNDEVTITKSMISNFSTTTSFKKQTNSLDNIIISPPILYPGNIINNYSTSTLKDFAGTYTGKLEDFQVETQELTITYSNKFPDKFKLKVNYTVSPAIKSFSINQPLEFYQTYNNSIIAKDQDYTINYVDMKGENHQILSTLKNLSDFYLYNVNTDTLGEYTGIFAYKGKKIEFDYTILPNPNYKYYDTRTMTTFTLNESASLTTHSVKIFNSSLNYTTLYGGLAGIKEFEENNSVQFSTAITLTNITEKMIIADFDTSTTGYKTAQFMYGTNIIKVNYNVTA